MISRRLILIENLGSTGPGCVEPPLVGILTLEAGFFPVVAEALAVLRGLLLDQNSGLLPCSVNFVARKANMAAYCLAKFGVSSLRDSVLLEEVPPCVIPFVSGDRLSHLAVKILEGETHSCWLGRIMEQPHPGFRGAEAVLNLQPGSSISVAYHPLFGPHDDLILLELDEKLLPYILHQRVTLRGQPDEDAVLCTPSKTYGIKFVGNSNSVFLIPPSDHSILSEASEDHNGKGHLQQASASVIKVAPGSMELVEVAPRLDKLRLLLSENPYRSGEALQFENVDGMEKCITGLYTWDDLVDKVQASDEELRTGLMAFSAVEIDGYWRIVDEEYMGKLLMALFPSSVLNDWTLNSLNEDEVVRVLVQDGFPQKLAHHCLSVYGSKVGEGVNGSCLWSLDERRVCVHFAREILRGGKRKMESLMEEWRRKNPEGMQASFDMLEGEVLTEKLGVDLWVRAFSVSALPLTPAERFSVLFKERAKWEWKDLQPYIRDLKVPGLSLEGLLLNHLEPRENWPSKQVIEYRTMGIEGVNLLGANARQHLNGVVLTFMIGSALAWILVKVTGTPQHLQVLVIGCSSAGLGGKEIPLSP
ncbi:hypothetical protein EZV62_009441 [Acer yangbiense]|uniref:Uncharacterized protein n=1 Tax=Acer yangbiense TaxID=1000413 RepID=A0A5C7HZ99_9ROSI|nr:hypothetical protein EZV62_009441 [Acer yangbiense]